MSEKLRKSLVLSSIASVIVLLLTLVVVTAVQLFTIAPLKRQRAELEFKLEQIIEERNSTESAIEYINGSKFLDEYAREILGYGKPGAIKFEPKK